MGVPVKDALSTNEVDCQLERMRLAKTQFVLRLVRQIHPATDLLARGEMRRANTLDETLPRIRTKYFRAVQNDWETEVQCVARKRKVEARTLRAATRELIMSSRARSGEGQLETTMTPLGGRFTV